ncbi:MAG: hypothetical protein Q7S52_04300, partial [bacterium]|nr:hypothetical protein [bacterium]
MIAWLAQHWYLVVGALIAYLILGFGLAYTKALQTGRTATEGLAHTIWALVPKTWGAQRHIGGLYTRKLEPLIGGNANLLHGIQVVLFGGGLIALCVVWFYVTALVFRDLFGEMAQIKVGPWSLPELLAFVVILMEVGVGYFVHDAFPKAFPAKAERHDRESKKAYKRRLAREGYKPQRTAFIILALLGLTLLGVEVMLAWRRVEIVAALAESWTDISVAARTAFALQIRGSLWIFVVLSVMIPIFIAVFAHQFHRLQEMAAKLLGYTLGSSVLGIGCAAIAVACAALAVVGV